MDGETLESIANKKNIKEMYESEFQNIDGDDLGSVIANANKEINYKIGFILFIFYIIINTDIFNDNILNKFSNTVDDTGTTNTGIIVCAGILAFMYIMLDIIDKKYEL